MIKFSQLLLQIDNAKHTLRSDYRYTAILENTGVELLKQSPYSPDLNLCDRFLLTRLQENCKATPYLSSDEVHEWDPRTLLETYLVRELEKLFRRRAIMLYLL